MNTETFRPESRQSRYSNLSFKIALIVVIVSVAPMILVTGLILNQFNRFSNQMIHAHLGELVEKHKQNIDSFLKEKLYNISSLTRSFEIEQFEDKDFLKLRLQMLQDAYGFLFVDLGLIDSTGKQVSYAGPFDLHKADYSKSDWFQKAIKSQQYISDVFLGLRGHPHFIVAVKQRWNGADFLLRATIDFGVFNSLVENLKVGETGNAFILNREGQFQTRPPQGKLNLTKQQYLNLFKKGEAALEEYLSLFKKGEEVPEDFKPPVGTSAGVFIDPHTGISKEFYADRYLQQRSTFSVEKIAENGDKYIIVAAFLKNGQWLLVFQQEYEDAFAQLKETQKMAGLISFIGALVIIIVAFIVSGQMTQRIATLDSEKEMMNQQVIETGKLASVGELAAGIAHEINNPVAIMVEEAGWIQDLMAEGIDNNENMAEFKRALKQIETQGRRCKEITHKLLSFARKTDSRIQVLEINELITEVVGLLSQKSRYANVEVNVDLDPDLPTVQGSATEMQQVLMNILHNAVDAMEKTGGKIFITSKTEADDIRISIADTGPGIPASNLGRLFDPFFTTKPVGKGTGLGLSICYGIIHKMGGRIDVESQVDKGTTFHIVLHTGKQTTSQINKEG